MLGHLISNNRDMMQLVKCGSWAHDPIIGKNSLQSPYRELGTTNPTNRELLAMAKHEKELTKSIPRPYGTTALAHEAAHSSKTTDIPGTPLQVVS